MKVILNADDFGRSTAINQAVIRAHREGVLTSASLMVSGQAAAEAVALARETPTLAVGLHLVVAGGRSVLPPEQIRHIVDEQGRFPDDPLTAGLRYYLSPSAQAELSREMEAQFQRFAAFGLALCHVDTHLHMHVHPTVFDLLLPMAEAHGACGLRIPRDDYWLAIGHSRRRLLLKTTWAVVFGLLTARCRQRLDGSRLVTTERVFGLMQTGRMEAAYVRRVLERQPAESAEIYFHPSLAGNGGGSQDDLQTLLSQDIRQLIEERGLRLATYATLGEE